MPLGSAVSGRAGARYGRLRQRGWVWMLSMLWVLIGAGGADYAFVCAMRGCTTVQCTNDEFLFPIYNWEPWLIATVGGLAAILWFLLAMPLLVAGIIRLRGWRLRNWRPTAAWAGTWAAGVVLMAAAAGVGGLGADGPGAAVSWAEFPILAAWLALGAAMTSVLAKRPAR